MQLMEQVDNVIRLIDVTQQEFLEVVNKQSFPLLYEMCLENMSKRFSDLKLVFNQLKEQISWIK